MLGATKNKTNNSEEKRKIFFDWMNAAIISVDCEEDKDIAKEAQEEET